MVNENVLITTETADKLVFLIAVNGYKFCTVLFVCTLKKLLIKGPTHVKFGFFLFSFDLDVIFTENVGLQS